MNTATLFCFLFVLGSVLTEKSETGKADEFEFLATVDGRSFFRYSIQNLSWEEAKANCASMNMILAEVTTVAQRDMLRSKLISGLSYWIGARDSHELRQFSYDSSNAPLPNLGSLWINVEKLTCASFFNHPEAPYYLVEACTRTQHSLCMI